RVSGCHTRFPRLARGRHRITDAVTNIAARLTYRDELTITAPIEHSVSAIVFLSVESISSISKQIELGG
ncbi:MAG: hypothetical protein J2P54_17785, partial [Bradyrhizobiaceae bacterium]|nr:hypothetical protein [Bradyrhizobiaceae bacterium]